MNETQMQNRITKAGDDVSSYDFESWSKDIELKDYLSNEYGVSYKSEKEMFEEAKAQEEQYTNLKPKIRTSFLQDGNELITKLTESFKSPQIIGIVADAHSGKSNLIHFIVDELSKDYTFNCWVYGINAKAKHFYSVQELEQLRNSVVFIDEMQSLFDFNDRKCKKLIETTLRRVYHNNNVLILCGVPENFKKFISAKLGMVIFKRTTLSDLINGSNIKNMLLSYRGIEMGSSMLDIADNQALLFDGEHFTKSTINYIEEKDTKKDNKPIIVPKSVLNNVEKNNVQVRA